MRALVVAALALAVVCSGAEPQPTLWIYTAPLIDGKQKCGPCRQLKRDVDAGRFQGFNIEWLETPDGYSSPCIYYRDPRGRWQRHLGWGPGEFNKFLAQYRSRK